MTEPLLSLNVVGKRFGGHQALTDVSLDVQANRITGLIGPNGAGKTTLFNIITGLLPPTTGTVKLEGRTINRLAPYKRARLGMARTFQRLELFTSLSVRDNILVAGEIRNGWKFLGDRVKPDDEADRIIELIGLSDKAHAGVGEIPTGQARLVELGRALMSRPRILLLDEPASGQDESETAAFGALLQRLTADGMTIFLVEHDMELVMEVCDDIHVLDFGEVIASGTPKQIQQDPKVLTAYLGADT